jgi:membrane-associated PAP2 superfamily phosphatase
MQYLKFFNIVFIIVQVSTFLGISTHLYVAKSNFSDLSYDLYGSEAPLMNSYILELVANKPFSIIFLAISIFCLYKIVSLVNLKKKLLLNITATSVHMLLGAGIITALYSV